MTDSFQNEPKFISGLDGIFSAIYRRHSTESKIVHSIRIRPHMRLRVPQTCDGEDGKWQHAAIEHASDIGGGFEITGWSWEPVSEEDKT